MYFIDTHSHIDNDKFKSNFDSMIKSCFEKKVKKIIVPNIDEFNIDHVINTCNRYPQNLFPTIGIHPTDIKKDYIAQIEIVKKSLEQNKFVAIGEVGLDSYWSEELIEEQVEAFKIQIDLAVEYNLPLIIHCRNAYDLLIKVLEEKSKSNKLTGVLHCFGGGIQEAKKGIKLGFKLGIGGVVTFNNAKLAEIVAEVGVEHLLLETDAPYLAPTPYRGKTNSPEYIPIIAEKIAELCNVPIEEVANVTTKNAEEIFKI